MNPATGVRVASPLPEAEHASVIAAYDIALSFLDEQVGEHGIYGHSRDLHREELNVPLIVAGPGIAAGQRVSYPVGLYDLFVTMLDLTSGITSPFYQFSLRRFWISGFQPGAFHDIVVSELIPPLADSRPVSISLVTSEWQYIHDSDGRSELYHWPTDGQGKG